ARPDRPAPTPPDADRRRVDHPPPSLPTSACRHLTFPGCPPGPRHGGPTTPIRPFSACVACIFRRPRTRSGVRGPVPRQGVVFAMTATSSTPPTGGPGHGPGQPDPGRPDPAAAPGRRSGQLYRRVALYLASQPDTVLKVGEITAAIGAPSAGAVFEALTKMAAAGYATHHTGPHRFQITQAGIDAA